MASATPIGKALEEAICCICLEYLTEPVTIDCGHNFCRACIIQYCEQRDIGSHTKFLCPQCRVPFQKGTFQLNRQLANIAETIRQERLKPGKAQKENLCEAHGEKLQLFCEEDGETICLVCRESRTHCAHTVFPLEEAAQDYKVKLQEALGPLRKELQETLTLTLNEEKISMEWQDMQRVLIRSENVKLQQPEAVSPALTNVYKICLDMREVLERFTMDVTLDPDTAQPSLVLSEDRKRVRLGDKRQNLPSNPERFDSCPSVLGTQGFTGGRRYWEVEVGDKTLGVCRESVHRLGNVSLTSGNGYWAVWLRGGEYKACTDPSTSFPVSVRPSRVGIFLDYEAGEVSFYNVTDRSHLFTFMGTFFGRLCPYFHPGLNAGRKNVAPLIICPVPTGGNLCP